MSIDIHRVWRKTLMENQCNTKKDTCKDTSCKDDKMNDAWNDDVPNDNTPNDDGHNGSDGSDCHDKTKQQQSRPKHQIIDIKKKKGQGKSKSKTAEGVRRNGKNGCVRGNKSRDRKIQKPPAGVRNWTPSTDDWIDYGSAGGIIIDPWNHPENPERYNMFIVKQRANSIWGLPKGHLEKDEGFEYAAMREVMEETGFDFSRLQEGTDYISVPINKSGCPEYPHRIKTHQIHIFVWMLLKPGQTLPKHGRDNREIQDFVWINTNRLRKLLEAKNPNFLCNRTINPKILYQVERACQKGYQMLQEHHPYFEKGVQESEI